MANERKDSVLVARGKTGDPEALNDLVGPYWRAAYTCALQILRSHEDAEDIAQKALLSAVVHLLHLANVRPLEPGCIALCSTSVLC